MDSEPWCVDMEFVKVGNIWVTTHLVSKGMYGGFPGMDEPMTNVSALMATAWTAARGYRLLTSDEWDMVYEARIGDVLSGRYEWTATESGPRSRVVKGTSFITHHFSVTDYVDARRDSIGRFCVGLCFRCCA